MVGRLILKDWYLQRWAISGALAVGAIAVALVGTSNPSSYYVGFVLLISVLITVGVQLAMSTVLLERKEQTLAFVMSLPISAREYTTAKLVGNLSMFIVPWATLLVASIAMILGRESLPDGSVPLTIILLGEIFVSTCVLLGVALVSESQAWSIGTLIAGNLFFNFFIFWVVRIPSIAAASKGNVIVWDGPVLTLLGGEVAAIVLALGLTFVLQDRKTDFI
jgi:ABC-type transport system involved in multi-copper enzyme maturation permease subunit